MIKHKIKLAFALFVISISVFSGSSFNAQAEPIDQIDICHYTGNQVNFIVINANDSGVFDAHKNGLKQVRYLIEKSPLKDKMVALFLLYFMLLVCMMRKIIFLEATR